MEICNIQVCDMKVHITKAWANAMRTVTSAVHIFMQSFSFGKQDMHIGLALLHYPLALVSMQSFSFGKQDMHIGLALLHYPRV